MVNETPDRDLHQRPVERMVGKVGDCHPAVRRCPGLPLSVEAHFRNLRCAGRSDDLAGEPFEVAVLEYTMDGLRIINIRHLD
mgnify:CR=1 FL=1